MVRRTPLPAEPAPQTTNTWTNMFFLITGLGLYTYINMNIRYYSPPRNSCLSTSLFPMLKVLTAQSPLASDQRVVIILWETIAIFKNCLYVPSKEGYRGLLPVPSEAQHVKFVRRLPTPSLVILSDTLEQTYHRAGNNLQDIFRRVTL